MNTKKNISHILNELLHRYEISEVFLARKLNIPRSTINRLVSGRTVDPKVSTISSIATYFGLSIDQLVGKKPIDQ